MTRPVTPSRSIVVRIVSSAVAIVVAVVVILTLLAIAGCDAPPNCPPPFGCAPGKNGAITNHGITSVRAVIPPELEDVFPPFGCKR